MNSREAIRNAKRLMENVRLFPHQYPELYSKKGAHFTLIDGDLIEPRSSYEVASKMIAILRADKWHESLKKYFELQKLPFRLHFDANQNKIEILSTPQTRLN